MSQFRYSKCDCRAFPCLIKGLFIIGMELETVSQTFFIFKLKILSLNLLKGDYLCLCKLTFPSTFCSPVSLEKSLTIRENSYMNV